MPFIRKALLPFLDLPDSADIRIVISWSAEGKPYLVNPSKTGLHLSLTHNQGTLVCTVGRGVQGCDLEIVSPRKAEEWQALLGEGNDALLAHLVGQGDVLRRAGTRIWVVLETVYKALAVQADPSRIRIVKKVEDTVLFQYRADQASCYVLTFPVRLTLGGERMLAVVVPEKRRNRIISDQVSVSGKIAHWPNKAGAFMHEFTTTFLEGRGPQGKIFFTNIPVWMGELRELALLPISKLLVQDIKSRQWGMVTNKSFITVDRQLDSYDTVIGEVRLLGDTDLSRSFLSLAFEWFKKQEDGSLVRAFSGTLATTWVRVHGHGHVQPAELPEYFTTYLEELFRSQGDLEVPELRGKERYSFFSKASPLFTATVFTRKRNMLFKQQFLTSREDSNLVGNIYFSHYYNWQARVRDHYLATQLSDISSRNLGGDFVCVHAEVHHLQEAMPFDIIEVSMYLYELFEEGFAFYFEYYSISEHGVRLRKLAHGEHSAVWIPDGQELSSEISSVTMPEEYLSHFMKIVGKMTGEV
ncbi:MAG: hypothetical protein D3909_12430 [Candidatus Electrothrix sp. ATG1]|nr:hypothetical protein [Candidatus Electrothrix sp. ATG1]